MIIQNINDIETGYEILLYCLKFKNLENYICSENIIDIDLLIS